MNVGLSKVHLSFISSTKSSCSDDDANIHISGHFFRFSLIPRHGGAYPRPLTSISKDWPSLMESLEMRKARFSKLIYCRKEKFENKGRFPIPSGQLQIREGVFSGWEHCHIQKGVLEPRDGGRQILKLWVGVGQES